jgi:hypothetical protein
MPGMPCNATELVHFRKRIGVKGFNLIFKMSAEVANTKTAVFNLFNIGSALLNAMTLCQLVKAIDDFNNLK